MLSAMSCVLRCAAEAGRAFTGQTAGPGRGQRVPADFAVHGVAGRVEHVRRSRGRDRDDLDPRMRVTRRPRPPAW